MKALVVYDSAYGNTAEVAKAIASALGAETILRRVGDLRPEELAACAILVVGSPTQGGRPTPTTRDALRVLPATALSGKPVAAFDTRLDPRDSGFFMRFLLPRFGWAANRIAAGLKEKGGVLAAPAEGFFVDGKEGPVKPGELDRARAWGLALAGRTLKATAA